MSCELTHYRIHHSEKDDIISISQSEDMYNALVKVDAPEVKFTKYPDLGHDSWTEAYNQPGVWEWLAEKSLPEGGGEAQWEATKNKVNVVRV